MSQTPRIDNVDKYNSIDKLFCLKDNVGNIIRKIVVVYLCRKYSGTWTESSKRLLWTYKSYNPKNSEQELSLILL